MGLILLYSNTPPQSELPAQRSSRLDMKRRTHTSPPQTQLAAGDVEAGAKLGEGWGREAFGEDVGELGGGRYVKDPHLADGNPITDKV
jgi:hypothetical protein